MYEKIFVFASNPAKVFQAIIKIVKNSIGCNVMYCNVTQALNLGVTLDRTPNTLLTMADTETGCI